MLTVVFGPDVSLYQCRRGKKVYRFPECGRHPREQVQFVHEVAGEDAVLITHSEHIILTALLLGKQNCRELCEDLKLPVCSCGEYVRFIVCEKGRCRTVDEEELKEALMSYSEVGFELVLLNAKD